MINWSHVNELKHDMADAFDEIVEVFLDEVQEGLAKLDSNRSAADMASGLHFLKGAALNLGFEKFAALCSDGEELANSGRPAEINLAAVRECYDKSKREFIAGLQRNAA